MKNVNFKQSHKKKGMTEIIFNELELRELGHNSLSLVCKVNDYSLSKEIRGLKGTFREVVPKETWKKAISNNPSIKLYYNHKNYFEFRKEIEFKIEEDGVYLFISLKDSEQGLYNAVKNSELTGLSFGFKCLKDKRETVGNFRKRTILDIDLFEVSLLDVTPCYNNTSIEIRNLNIPINWDIYRKHLELFKLS